MVFLAALWRVKAGAKGMVSGDAALYWLRRTLYSGQLPKGKSAGANLEN
jgi:hypothetical protein